MTADEKRTQPTKSKRQKMEDITDKGRDKMTHKRARKKDEAK